ncbi:MAG TPA: hypothetical protein VMT04_01210, partial [Terriglobales bacterium]|nr:hypothetical protein [Terriglobales bacterium]
GVGLTGLGLLGSLEGDTGGEGGGSAAGPVILFFGLGLFVGSWMYDVIGSPFAVKDQNDKILGKKPFPYDLDLQLEKDNQQIKCLLVKHF